MTESAPPIPLTVIGGFLGAGKTTFLNRLVVHSNAPGCAILVNDFGDIAIDEALIREHGGDTISLKNGCVCCTIGSDLGHALSRIINAKNRPEHVIIEASGVANPGRIMDVARISRDLKNNGVIVIVDAPSVLRQLDDIWVADTVRTQLASADLLVLSKATDIDGRLLETVISRIEEEFPRAPLIVNFELSWRLLRDGLPASLQSSAASDSHFEFDTRNICTSRTLDPERLKHWIDRRNDIYRVKGWIRLDDDRYCLIQAVGRRTELSEIKLDHSEGTRLVVIGRSSLPDSDTIIQMLTQEPVRK